MLSKVLPARDSAGVRPVLFPAVGQPMRSAPATPDLTAEDAASLLNQVRSFDARLAAARAEAFEAGRAQSEKDVQPVLERLNASVAELVSLRQNLRQSAERGMVELALMIARRVLHRELTVDDHALNAIARVAFDRLARSESYSLTVHPRFAEAIREALPGEQASRVHIQPDAACPPGTLIFHSSEGRIDASVETQLEEISRGLTDRLGLNS